MTTEEPRIAVPLLAPAQGLPPVVDTEESFEKLLLSLAQGSGPFALDTERASGYKFFARAYLIQVARDGGGLHLIDPIPFGPGHRLFTQLNELFATDEVILHASTQDLPCLRELGINPVKLFDTELGARLAGLPRVGLGPLLESLLGVLLAKEHSAVDWSTRPLPADWLNYAALDVELLVELRDEVDALLDAAGKSQWAEEEFAAILKAPPNPPRVDPWRRTSGVHHIKKRRQLAVVKEFWESRVALAEALDVSPSRLLSDAAISAIALSMQDDSKIERKKDLEKILRPIGLRARWLEHHERWLACIASAQSLSEDQLPPVRGESDALPPMKVWREKYPLRYAALTHAKHTLLLRAQDLSVPLENLISPEFVRRICWSNPRGEVQNALLELGARKWQVEIVTPMLEAALLQETPLVIEEEALPPATDASTEE